MHAFARDVAGDGSRVGLTADLIDLVDEHDAALGAFDVHVGRLQEAQDDRFHVVADVAGFREGGGVGDRERHVEHARERAGEECLARARRADQQHVALVEFDVGEVASLGGGGLRVAIVEALVVIEDRDRENLLRVSLADDVRVEFEAQFRGRD